MARLNFPIIRYPAREAVAGVREGRLTVVPMAKGHAEVWDIDTNCIGFLTRRSFEIFQSFSDVKVKAEIEKK